MRTGKINSRGVHKRGLKPQLFQKRLGEIGSGKSGPLWGLILAHQNRTIAVAGGFRVDQAKSPEIPQEEGFLGSEIAARKSQIASNFRSIAPLNCNGSIAFLYLSAIARDFWGLQWAIAIANRKNRCDFGAVRA